MKMKSFYCICLLLIILQLSFEKVSSLQLKQKMTGLYFLQKLYPGNDIKACMRMNNEMKLVFLTLNSKQLYYSPSFERINQIEDTIPLEKIVDSNFDNPPLGKCCYNIMYRNYQTSINQKMASISKYKHKGIQNILRANHCIEILVPNKSRWRICSNKHNSIYKLHTQISYNILMHFNKKNPKLTTSIFLNNFNIREYEQNIEFKWENQLKWKNRCKSNFIQSPINLETTKIIPISNKDLFITYNFYDVYPIVSRRFNEAIVKFSHHPGVLMMSLNSNKIIFIPKYISFRFPSEHSFMGNRYSGEIQIHLEELMPDKKRHFVNGLMISIPMEMKSEYHNFSPLEPLGMDFWKQILQNKKTYKPKNFMNKQRNVFSLSEIFNQILISKSKYFLYLGSETVPPCTDFIYHIVVEKPLKISNCQFKILRENSLLVGGFRQIHTRLTQNLNNRGIYSTNTLSMNPNLESNIPKEFLDISKELYQEPLLKQKLTTVDRIKALKKLKKGIKSGKIKKYDKKGVKIVREGVGIKDVLYGDHDGWKGDKTDPNYQKKFGKNGKYAKYGKYANLFGRNPGSGRGHGLSNSSNSNC